MSDNAIKAASLISKAVAPIVDPFISMNLADLRRILNGAEGSIKEEIELEIIRREFALEIKRRGY